MPTQIFDFTTIIKAIQVAEQKFLGTGRTWATINEDQIRFLKLFNKFGEKIAKIVGLTAEVSHGNKHDDRMSFRVTAKLDRLVAWSGIGRKNEIKVGESTFPAFLLDRFGVSFHEINFVPAVCLDTQSGDKVWLTFADRELPGLNLVDKILDLIAASKTPLYNTYKAVIIPEVLVDQQPDITFLLGMCTHDDRPAWYINEATEKAKFAMNDKGARVVVRTRIGVTLGGSTKILRELVFNRPFYLWIEDQKTKLPVAMLYVDKDCWRKANLSAL